MAELIHHSPRDLPDAEWKVLAVLCEDARDSTRRCWPGAGEVEERTGKAESTVRRLLTGLERRKLIRRVPAPRQQPDAVEVVAHRGRRTVFEILPMPGRDGGKALTSEPLPAEKGAHARAERGSVPSSKGPRGEPPSPHVPADPLTDGPVAIDAAAVAAVREALRARTQRDVGDEWAVRVAAQLLAGRTGITSPARWLTACIQRDAHPERFLPIASPGYEAP